MPDTPLFDGWPEAERVIDVPVTLELMVTWFVTRWGYNTTAQERMRPELEDLIAKAKADAVDKMGR